MHSASLMPYLAGAIGVGLAATVPFFVLDGFVLYMLNLSLIGAITAAGLNITNGYLGILNLSVGGQVALGAYVCALTAQGGVAVPARDRAGGDRRRAARGGDLSAVRPFDRIFLRPGDDRSGGGGPPADPQFRYGHPWHARRARLSAARGFAGDDLLDTFGVVGAGAFDGRGAGPLAARAALEGDPRESRQGALARPAGAAAAAWGLCARGRGHGVRRRAARAAVAIHRTWHRRPQYAYSDRVDGRSGRRRHHSRSRHRGAGDHAHPGIPQGRERASAGDLRRDPDRRRPGDTRRSGRRLQPLSADAAAAAATQSNKGAA